MVNGMHAEGRERFITELEAERERLGLTNRDFARRLGIDEATWSEVRRGITRPTSGLLIKVAGRIPELAADAIALGNAA